MTPIRFAGLFPLTLLFSCSGSDAPPSNATLGTGGQATGGQGGSSSSEPISGSGGATTGDSSATSGTSNTGGATPGGASATGGSPGSGGTSAAGGGKGSGGASAAGGSPGSGGASAAGGSKGSGGASAAGGSPGSGGASAAGGGKGSGGASATGGGKGSGGTSATGGSTNSGGANCNDTCPTSSTGYITVGCKKRFMYGANYAWQNFGTDFGGYAKWSQSGVAAAKAQYTSAMQDMKNNGVDVIRWWMFPNLDVTDGITWSGTDTATGLGSTTIADIEAALEIAASLDMHIQLTPFSFDDFKTANNRRLDKIIGDPTKMASLINNVIKPMAAAVEASPNKDRMVSWDVINEPEWAITGADSYGDQDFGADSTCSPVEFTAIETFVKNVVTAIHASNTAPVTVGGAAVKWAKAWSKVGVDFFTFHMYGWVNDWFPYDQPPSYYGITGMQVNIGEFPLSGLPASTQRGTGAVDYVTMVNKLWSVGYAGAQGWAVTDGDFDWSGNKANVKVFADAKGCMVKY